jgi:hypothetical protein
VPPGTLSGRLVFTDRGCSLGQIDLANGRREQVGTFATSCGLVAPPESPRVAVSLPSRFRGVVPYRALDLEEPEPALALFEARIRSPVWSADGSRLSWCDPKGRGLEVEAAARSLRRLQACPIAYTPGAEPVYLRGRNVIVWDGAVIRAPGRIAAVSFTRDGIAGVATPSRLLVYRVAGGASFELLEGVLLPPAQRGLEVRFSPTLCHAALVSTVFPPTPTVFVVDLLGCDGSRAPLNLSGRAAAWSPDGDRIAVAERNRVVVHTAVGDDPPVALDLEASALAWQASH